MSIHWVWQGHKRLSGMASEMGDKPKSSDDPDLVMAGKLLRRAKVYGPPRILQRRYAARACRQTE